MIKYNFIKAHLKQWSVALMCNVIKASRGGFYRWMQLQRGYVKPRERYLLFKIKEIYAQNKGNYGSRRIYRELKSQGIPCYANQIAQIMKKNGIKAKTKKNFRVTTDSNHSYKVTANLLNRNFKVNEKNRVWVGDITYIWTNEGWLYLSTVIDLYSRKVIAWSVDKRMSKSLVLTSIEEAFSKRNPPPGLIFHSDRGSQYASDDFKSILQTYKAQQSMSRKGDCWDNAVAESFFKTIKRELIYWEKFKTRKEAELRIFEYIEIIYNRHRLHSTINYMSPDAYEMQCLS